MTLTDDQGWVQKISGTYLVTYFDKISLNGTWFVNQLGSSMKKTAVPAMTVVNITTHQNRLSNLHHIGTLRENLTVGSFLSYSFALLASFLLCSTVWLGYRVLRTRWHDNLRTNGDIELSSHRDGDLLKEGGVNTSGSHEEKLSSCRPYPVALSWQSCEHSLSEWSPDTKWWPCTLTPALRPRKGLKLWPDQTLQLVKNRTPQP